MKTIHFLDLREFAVRGELERGRRYVRVHSMTGHPVGGGSSVEPFAYEILTYSGMMRLRNGFEFSRTPRNDDNPYWDNREWRVICFSIKNSYSDLAFASDLGLWDIPGSYKNEWNYVLDVLALLRLNIVVGGIKP